MIIIALLCAESKRRYDISAITLKNLIILSLFFTFLVHSCHLHILVCFQFSHFVNWKANKFRNFFKRYCSIFQHFLQHLSGLQNSWAVPFPDPSSGTDFFTQTMFASEKKGAGAECIGIFAGAFFGAIGAGI